MDDSWAMLGCFRSLCPITGPLQLLARVFELLFGPITKVLQLPVQIFDLLFEFPVDRHRAMPYN